MNRFLLLLLFVAPPSFAQGSLEVISLRHRTAEQVIPVLRPLLEPGGALSGQYNQLIVRTSPGNLAEIRAVLDSIDQPARRLTISVRFDTAQDGVRGSRDERVDQRIQVLEGGQAFISTGASRNYAQADTGFAVLPRVSGSNVFLEIGTRQEAFSRGGAIQSQRAATTVSGRLGEWIELGGVDSASPARERTASIWVKVEELR
jgi:Bacterial type II/III secretion system short domain